MLEFSSTTLPAPSPYCIEYDVKHMWKWHREMHAGSTQQLIRFYNNTVLPQLIMCHASSVWPLTKGLEQPSRPTTSHHAPDCWIRSSTTQHRSGNCLSSSIESSSLEQARRNGNIQHWTNLTMMTMILVANKTQGDHSFSTMIFHDFSMTKKVNFHDLSAQHIFTK